MTSKDMNLTLDQHLAAQPGSRRRAPSRPVTKKRPAPVGGVAAANSVPGTPRSASPGVGLSAYQDALRGTDTAAVCDTPPGSKTGGNRRPLLANLGQANLGQATLGLVMLANIALLGGAGYWLYLHFDEITFFDAPVHGQASSAFEKDTVAQALALNSRDIAAIDTRLAQLQQALIDQRQLMAGALLDIEEQLASLAVDQSDSPDPAVASDRQLVPVRWVINAGTFSSVEPARTLVKQLTDMGYEARLGEAATGGGKVHRVQVSGFADRAAAEAVAREIVGQTDLNGLWVWKNG